MILPSLIVSSRRWQTDDRETPRTISIEFRNVPGGDYDIRGTLIGSAGKQRAAVRQHVIVIDPAPSGGVFAAAGTITD
jgi:hypothetical protein